MIPLTAAEARRLFCLYTRVTHPEEFHEHGYTGGGSTRPAPANPTTSAEPEVDSPLP